MGQIKNIKLHIVTDIKIKDQRRVRKCTNILRPYLQGNTIA